MELRMYKKYFTLFILISVATSQTGSIAGFITDGSTNEPLVGANIYVMGTSLGSASDEDGRYSIPNLPIGKQTIKISYISLLMGALLQIGEVRLNVTFLDWVLKAKVS